MYVFELRQPGTWLEGIEDDVERRDSESLLRLLVDCVEDAAVSLNLFEARRHVGHRSGDDRRSRWEAERQRERLIEAEMEARLAPDLSWQQRGEAMDAIREQSRVEAKRQRWREGEPPESYLRREMFIHARSFLYALDTLGKALALLAEKPSAPEAVETALAGFRSRFPDLVHVRDSAHHAEDRVQGKKRASRIQLQPVVNDFVHAEGGGVLIHNSLVSNRYGGTLADGSYGEVEVSPESAAVAQTTVQTVLDAYSWKGPAHHTPM